jgi:Zn-dependent peptidase ImmA (M78 family)
MRKLVCKAILHLPPELIEQVTHRVWFISSQDDAWAFTFRGSDIRDAHLIFISDELLIADEAQITYTILHEIGHVVKAHRNSLGGYMQTESEIHQQEDEADLFAQEMLRNKS